MPRVPSMPVWQGSISRSRKGQLATGSQSRGSQEPLATGSKTMMKRETKKNKKTEVKHAADSEVDVQSAKRKLQPRPPDHPPPTGGRKMRKRAKFEVSLSPSSDLDSRPWRRRERRPARARVRSSESVPGGDGDRASPPAPAPGGGDGTEDMSPTRDASASGDASPVEQSASPLASGSDEDDKKDASPLAEVVPASGGSSSRGWAKPSGAKWKSEGKGKPGKLASGSIHPTARRAARYSQQHPHQPWALAACSTRSRRSNCRVEGLAFSRLAGPWRLSRLCEEEHQVARGGLFA